MTLTAREGEVTAALRAFAVLAALLAASVPPPALAEAPRPTVIIVDASGSMSASMGGATRLDSARRVLSELMGRWPRKAPLGLIAYGHRRTGDCDDIEVLVPIGPPDAAAVRGRLSALRARGKTPLATSLQRAAGVLEAAGKGGSIILVTDGIETCHPDPCAVAAALRAADATLVVHVIAFAVEAKDEEQLSCIAKAGGGLYRTAGDAEGLLASLDVAAREARERPAPATEPAPTPPRSEPSPTPPTPEPSPTATPIEKVAVNVVAVIEKEGPVVDHAFAWRIAGEDGPEPFLHSANGSAVELTVPAGRYRIEAKASNVSGSRAVEITGETKRIEVPLAAGRLLARAVPYAGGEALKDGLRWTLVPLDGQVAVEAPTDAKPSLLLAAGRYRIAVEHEGRRAETEVTVAGGRPLDQELSLRLGELKLTAAVAEDAEPLTDWHDVTWRAHTPDGAIAAEVMQQPSPLFVLPAGRYRVSLTSAGATIERDVEVVEGKRQDARLVIPTGSRTFVAALAPGLEPLSDWRDTSWTVKAVDAIGVAPGTAVRENQAVANPTSALMPGRWSIAVKSGSVTAQREIVVVPESKETVRLNVQAARLRVTAAPPEGAAPAVNITFEIFPVAADGSLGPAAFATGSPRSAETILAPGRWRVSAVDHHSRRVESTLELSAGEEKVLELTLQ